MNQIAILNHLIETLEYLDLSLVEMALNHVIIEKEEKITKLT